MTPGKATRLCEPCAKVTGMRGAPFGFVLVLVATSSGCFWHERHRDPDVYVERRPAVYVERRHESDHDHDHDRGRDHEEHHEDHHEEHH